jgi:hypothetical protein
VIRLSVDFPNNVLSILFHFFSLYSVHNDGDDEAVEAEGFGENEDEDHSDVDVFLGVGADTGITDNSDGESSSEGGETTAHASSKMLVSFERSVLGGDGGVRGLLDSSDVDDGDNEAVNSENTSHDTGNEGLEHKVGSHHTDGADTNSGLGGSIGGTEVSEYKGRSDSHESEEGVLVNSSQLLVDEGLSSTILNTGSAGTRR